MLDINKWDNRTGHLLNCLTRSDNIRCCGITINGKICSNKKNISLQSCNYGKIPSVSGGTLSAKQQVGKESSLRLDSFLTGQGKGVYCGVHYLKNIKFGHDFQLSSCANIRCDEINLSLKERNKIHQFNIEEILGLPSDDKFNHVSKSRQRCFNWNIIPEIDLENSLNHLENSSNIDSDSESDSDPNSDPNFDSNNELNFIDNDSCDKSSIIFTGQYSSSDSDLESDSNSDSNSNSNTIINDDLDYDNDNDNDSAEVINNNDCYTEEDLEPIDVETIDDTDIDTMKYQYPSLNKIYTAIAVSVNLVGEIIIPIRTATSATTSATTATTIATSATTATTTATTTINKRKRCEKYLRSGKRIRYNNTNK